MYGGYCSSRDVATRKSYSVYNNEADLISSNILIHALVSQSHSLLNWKRSFFSGRESWSGAAFVSRLYLQKFAVTPTLYRGKQNIPVKSRCIYWSRNISTTTRRNWSINHQELHGLWLRSSTSIEFLGFSTISLKRKWQIQSIFSKKWDFSAFIIRQIGNQARISPKSYVKHSVG